MRRLPCGAPNPDGSASLLLSAARAPVRLVGAVIFVTASTVILARLGDGSLVSWDEALYAQQSKEMARTGDWLTPTWSYVPWFHKGPLYFWVTAPLIRLFGVTEFWVRLPSALCGIALVMVTYAIGKHLGGAIVAVLGALILLVSSGFLWYARSSYLDVMLTFLSFAALYSFLRVRDDRRWWYPLSASLALAFMLKSAAVFIPIIPIVLELGLDRGSRLALRSRHIWLSIAVGALIVVPWHAWMSLLYGREFWDVYAGINVAGRVTRALDGQGGDPWYYVDILRTDYFPWLFLLPPAVLLAVREALRGATTARMLLTTVVVVFSVFTLASTKLPWYIVPLYPAASILIASMLARWIRPRLSLVSVGVGVSLGLLFIASIRTLGPVLIRTDYPSARFGQLAAKRGTVEPLLVFPDADDCPTILYYSDRPVIVVTDELEVVGNLGPSGAADLIGRSDEMRTLEQCCVLETVATSGRLTYAVVRNRDPSNTAPQRDIVKPGCGRLMAGP
jgi:4-amino-4-deoxy-L-arabinose transferase-like glycosyltransferase